ncbi:dihydroxyacetone kinase phosphoryl donor subunit DhaM [Aeromonas hydrophila]|uniref:dihydroxyacetone kinase phosphoryl donor subunit DhaM n=2 Tax=Aeromonas hydrophila TaxID=644 RepID=UPI000332A7FB|nr:dihydroxyacetone kinase phosphoryl donor subunit DhaM [Aeromonas hydrophila]AGM45991.1 PTS-dependent dihydroxyacetone kinase, phosphotransferase subunit DhaM [Aeromonas hydrophila ML09-119]AHX34603.1 dihydroxyacetone kinase [Aeromonas hydrophila subsp. hydrophila AL09-71]AHX71403.1 dihydroxyacetone kinase [Aeromonas hydrophila pc104A]AJE34659.1 dihydroxyacetone kinase [Aeromonas hydrophila J-1]AKJ32854.1 dihydroxyacetone kinase [Aeromonas hydrophila NJ-35]
MIGIVVVSHSAMLAAGLKALADQLGSPAKLLLAAGVDDPDHPIGTDAIAVMSAIEEADDGSGVLVLMDLGSALLSAETALELLPPQRSARVRLCPAPLVEGTLAAVVAAGSGLTLDEVAAEALGALGPKQAMLPGKSEPQVIEAAPAPDDGWQRCEVVVDNPHGLHVRPAARLVAALKPFAAELRLQKEDKEANPRSLTRLTMLNVRQGDRLILLARGEDAEAALACFQQLALERFGD